jgi:hypothetical protein
VPPQYGGGIRGAHSPIPGGGAGGGFHMSVQFTSNRTRPDTTGGTLTTALFGQGIGGRQQLGLNTGFSPTPHWTLSWNTSYDLDTRRFGQHYVRLERDLHRWHASFAFAKSANGNFAFNFYISLLDQPDIKFEYDQQTYPRP